MRSYFEYSSNFKILGTLEFKNFTKHQKIYKLYHFLAYEKRLSKTKISN